nr:unnamed protein product [Spirometra erinaceieuropaei]
MCAAFAFFPHDSVRVLPLYLEIVFLFAFVPYTHLELAGGLLIYIVYTYITPAHYNIYHDLVPESTLLLLDYPRGCCTTGLKS